MEYDIEPISPGVSRRAGHADPNGRRCLIENCSSTNAIEFVHVFDRVNALDSRQTGALEWYWNREKHTLNFDTQRNVFFCGASLHQLYKERKWALLPEFSDVQQYYGWAIPFGRTQFPINNEPTFQYTFLPLQDMEDVYLTRQRDLSDGQQTVDVYHYPFTDFPKITSHVHPTFAIIHLGSILRSESFNHEIRMSLYERYPFLRKVCNLRNKWTGLLPSTAEEDPTYITDSRAREVRHSQALPPSLSPDDSTPRRRLVAVRVEAKGNDESEESSNFSSSSSTEVAQLTSLALRQLKLVKAKSYGNHWTPAKINAWAKSNEPPSASTNLASSRTRYHMPGTMKYEMEPISPGVARRAGQADPNERRCLIENQSSTSAIEVVHVWDRVNALDQQQAGAVEWFWKREKYTLNLDTQRNVFFCGASLHQLYKERKWALLPEASDVRQYYGRAIPYGRIQFPINDRPTFQYTFLPLQDMKDIHVTRQRDLPDSDGQQMVDVYHYPYNDFPKITSHVHPTFAIIHLGSIINSRSFNHTIRMSLYDKYPFLRDICHLSNHWTGRVPDHAEEDTTYITKSRASGAQDLHTSTGLLPSDDGTCTPQRRLWVRRIEAEMSDEAPCNSSESSSSGSPSRNASEITNLNPPQYIPPPKASNIRLVQEDALTALRKQPRGQATQLTSEALRVHKLRLDNGRRHRKQWTPIKILALIKGASRESVRAVQ
ncbi:hypothetical protein CVT24_008965 [Panaeolus cyanescens]|uniref:HNH nuclease domain-containing protein n=1 Tax=Panaeolus cyanescens TaxID=181874 RepID=A0A409YAT4_9AGAR|nr:hypothetical protein CVT24_008965 [Panaeolus cyanescens]